MQKLNGPIHCQIHIYKYFIKHHSEFQVVDIKGESSIHKYVSVYFSHTPTQKIVVDVRRKFCVTPYQKGENFTVANWVAWWHSG